MDDAALTVTLCELVGEIDGFAFRMAADYQPNEVGVFYGPIGAKPDRAVGIRVYSAVDEYGQPAGRRAQIRYRGAPGRPDGADVLAGQVFATLHRLSRTGGMNGVTRSSMAQLGADANRREQRADNYLIVLDNPEAST